MDVGEVVVDQSVDYEGWGDGCDEALSSAEGGSVLVGSVNSVCTVA